MRSSRRETFASPAAGTGTGKEVDLDGTFLDRTAGPPFMVADGGILDNIPIRTALDFIANAPATGPTERYLVYLQPGASTTKETAAELRADERQTTLAVVRGVLGARVAGETINSDIAAIEAYNESIERARRVRHATFNGLAGRDDLLEAALVARPAYNLTRASFEAGRVFALLLDPIGVTGEDQFPATVAGEPVGDAQWRSPIAGWPQQHREGLEALLSQALDRVLGQKGAAALACTGDIGPLLRVTDLLIEWSRWAERIPATRQWTPAEASAVKGSLYRIRAFLGAVLHRARRLAWVSAASRVDGRDVLFAARALESLGQLARVGPATVTATVDALRSGAEGPLRAACHVAPPRIADAVRDLLSGLASGAPLVSRPAEAGTDLLAGIASLLEEVVRPLAKAPPTPGKKGEECEPGQLLHRVLGGDEVTSDVLVALDALCLPEFVAGRPGRRRIDFRRLSTANRTPLAQNFTTLTDAAQEQGLWWDPEEPPEAQQGIHVTLKLAGNELANFSAFLLSHWRANDWLWGRLDAVPTMVDLLVRPAPLLAHLAGLDVDEALEAVHQLVAPSGDDWHGRLDSLVWAPSAALVREEVEELLAAEDGAAAGEVAITNIRSALIARRQWEILGEEKALPTEKMGVQPGVDLSAPTLEAVEAWVAGYGVGAETVRHHHKAPELLDRFGEIATAATEMALYNVSLES